MPILTERGRSAGACALFAIVLFACSGRHAKDDPLVEPIAVPSCEAYVVRYGACLSKLGKGGEAAVERRVASTRRAFTAAAGDEAGRARLDETCTAGLKRLESSCR